MKRFFLEMIMAAGLFVLFLRLSNEAVVFMLTRAGTFSDSMGWFVAVAVAVVVAVVVAIVVSVVAVAVGDSLLLS